MQHYTSIIPLTGLADRLQRLIDLVNAGERLCSSQEGLEAHYQNCHAEALRLISVLDSEQNSIKECVALFPPEEVFNIDYLQWINSFEGVRSGLKSKQTDSPVTSLNKILKTVVTRLATINNLCRYPKTRAPKIYDNLVHHYQEDHLVTDMANFDQQFGYLLKGSNKQKSDRIERKLREMLGLLENSAFMRPLIREAGGSFTEAFQSLLTEGTTELNPEIMAGYIISKRDELKTYDTINEFFRLHLYWQTIMGYRQDLLNEQEDKERREFRQTIIDLVRPLRSQAGIGYKQCFIDIWNRLLDNEQYYTLMRTPTLDEAYNAKLLLNTLGIMITRQVLTGSISGIRQMLYTTRRDDFMRSTAYDRFGTTHSALTPALKQFILDTLQTSN